MRYMVSKKTGQWKIKPDRVVEAMGRLSPRERKGGNRTGRGRRRKEGKEERRGKEKKGREGKKVG